MGWGLIPCECKVILLAGGTIDGPCTSPTTGNFALGRDLPILPHDLVRLIECEACADSRPGFLVGRLQAWVMILNGGTPSANAAPCSSVIDPSVVARPASGMADIDAWTVWYSKE